MMLNSSKLVTLLRCNSVWEADILRERLESAGIPAFTQGAESARSLSYVGAGLGGVKLQVSEVDLESARQVLDEDVKQHQTAGDWRCPRCDEPNEAAFDFCYSCSLPRGDAPAVSIFEAESEGQGAASDLNWVSSDARLAQPQADPTHRNNPYRTPDAVREPRQTNKHSSPYDPEVMRTIKLWTVFGCCFPIPIFPPIALLQLARVAIENGGVRKSFRTRWLIFFCINAFLLLGWFVVVYFSFQ